MNDGKSWTRRVLLVVPLVLGVAALVVAVKTRQPPSRIQTENTAPSVRVVSVAALTVTPSISGRGTVAPARQWAAVAEVSGRVVDVHRLLRNGHIIPAGAVLLRIDRLSYELTLAQRSAELAEMRTSEENFQAMLELERRALTLARQDLQRKTTLVEQGAVPVAAVDAAEQTLLQRQRAVRDLENRLRLIPHQQAVLQAREGLARLDLEHTVVRAPFDLRVSGLRVEAEQFVAKGQVLFDGDAIDRVEVTAQIPLNRLFILMQHRPDIVLDPVTMTETLPKISGLTAELWLDLGQTTVRWPARFTRFSETIDPKTRTLGVVVSVDDPILSAEPGIRPPLVKGMFVGVRLWGAPQKDRLVLPRSAIRDGAVWIVDKDDRLRRRPVSILYNLGPAAVIAQGLNPGERVMVSNPVPTIDGMTVTPHRDEVLAEHVRQAVQPERSAP